MCKEKQQAHQERSATGHANSNSVLFFLCSIPTPYLLFCILKRSLKVLQEAMSSVQVIFILPLNFYAHYPKLHLILLPLSLLSWLSFVTQLVAT